jgi:hypothetical protein
MLLTRVLGRGEASEHMDSADPVLEVDLFFRRMGWGGGLDRELEKLPWELKLLGYQPPPWALSEWGTHHELRPLAPARDGPVVPGSLHKELPSTGDRPLRCPPCTTG